MDWSIWFSFQLASWFLYLLTHTHTQIIDLQDEETEEEEEQFTANHMVIDPLHPVHLPEHPQGHHVKRLVQANPINALERTTPPWGSQTEHKEKLFELQHR